MPQNEQSTRPLVDRRKKKKDWVAYAVSIFSGLAWAAAVIILVLLDRARPKTENFFTRFINAPVVSVWNSGLLRAALILMICVLAVCIIGIAFNATRLRRKGDKINRSIVTLAVSTVVGIALFLYQFSHYL